MWIFLVQLLKAVFCQESKNVTETNHTDFKKEHLGFPGTVVKDALKLIRDALN